MTSVIDLRKMVFFIGEKKKRFTKLCGVLPLYRVELYFPCTLGGGGGGGLRLGDSDWHTWVLCCCEAVGQFGKIAQKKFDLLMA